MRIYIDTIPHKHQRYPTCGDWYFMLPDDSALEITVSSLADEKQEFLVGIHELIEAMLCRSNGISEESVTKFDLAFNKLGEPGDDPAAPYHHEHMVATFIERILAIELGVDWKKYEEAINNLDGGAATSQTMSETSREGAENESTKG